jgi:two-component system cell cycle sensor histidine kinase/response regulator CckA
MYSNAPKSRTVRILVVEDERIVAMSLKRQLNSLGYEVVAVCSSGTIAIQKAESLRPNLVLMDIQLEGTLDGVEAAAIIRRRFAIPVVFLTAYSNQEVLERAKVTEPYGYILKPYEDRELHVVIETAIHKHCSERKLVESEKRYQATFQSVADGIIVVNAAAQVALLNPAAERMTGCKSAETSGLPLQAVFQLFEENGNPAYPGQDFAVVGGSGTYCLPLSGYLVNREGRRVLIEGTVASLECDNNREESYGAVIAFRDVTEQRRAERTRQQFQKLEALGILAGGVAHDFNNLLTPMIGYAELLKTRVGADRDAADMIQSIQIAARTAGQLTREMLAYVGKGLSFLEAANLTKVVQETAPLLATVVSKKADVSFDLAVELPTITADVSQIRQILLNLVTNASDSLGENRGSILVTTRLVSATFSELSSPFIPETPAVGEFVVLEISDTGCGMSAETIERVFEPFFTTKPAGHGLGLAAILGIVRAHGGTVKVRSQPERGAAFAVYFPVREDAILTRNGIPSFR